MTGAPIQTRVPPQTGFASPARGAAALLLLTLLLYANSLGGGFILDDNYIYAGDSPLLTHGVKDAFTRDFFTLLGNKFQGLYYYRPLLALAHIWLAGLTHAQPFGLHLASVLLHAGAGILAFLLLREFMEARLAWLAAALFVAHPMHVEAVSWLAAINEPEAAVFMLLSLYLLARAHPGAAPAFFWSASPAAAARPERPGSVRALFVGLSCLAAAAAYLTKESALVLPLIAAIFVGWRAWPLAVTGIATFSLRFLELGLATSGAVSRGVIGRVSVAASAFALYIRNALAPWPLAAEYDLRQPFAVWLVVAAACAAGAWLAARQARFRTAALLFLLPLAPAIAASSALPALRQAQDRYAYLAVLGIAFAIGASATTRMRFRAAVVLLTAWLILSSLAIPRWRDSEHLWTHTLRVTPNSRNAVIALGEWYFSTGQLREAARIYDYGLRLRPNDPDYLASAAAVRKAMGSVQSPR